MNKQGKNNCSITILRVRYSETDQMQIAHHSSYVSWLELARVEWLRERSLQYTTLEASGVALGVTGLNIRYLRPAHFDELISVDSSLIKVKSRLLVFEYALKNESGLQIATASTNHVPINRNGKITSLPTTWQNLLVEYLENR
ncbi:MAG: hypothetical protein CMO31_07330 [Trueperaceae bacterium]|nr:hypothetical protein [Trueperaceae bacterium]MCH2667490.1 acyl-CoA thioesterase [Deinococcales bacterium]